MEKVGYFQILKFKSFSSYMNQDFLKDIVLRIQPYFDCPLESDFRATISLFQTQYLKEKISKIFVTNF